MPPSRDIASLINKIEALDAGSVVKLTQESRPTPPVARKTAPTTTVKPQPIVEVAPAPPVVPQNLEISAEGAGSGTHIENPTVVETEESYQPEVAAIEDSTVDSVDTGLVSSVAVEVAASDKPEAVSGGKSWLGFVQYVKKERPRIGSLLEHGSLLKFELPAVRVGFERASFMLQQLSDAETKERLNSLAQQFFEQQVQVVVESLSAAAAAPLSLVAAEEKRESDRGRRLREDALAHPMVRKAVEIFSGEIEKITPIDKGFV